MLIVKPFVQPSLPNSPNQDPYLKLRDKAYRLLARREHSAVELRRKLLFAPNKERADCPEQVQRVTRLLAELAERGAQSDSRFAEQRCRQCHASGRGPVKLRHILTEHRIDQSLVAQAMAKYEPRWQALAAEVRLKKFGDAQPSSYRDWSKQARFLQQRGFTGDQIPPYSG